MPVHEKIFFQMHQNFTPFAPYWFPIYDASPLIFANLNHHSLKMVPTKFV